MLDNHEANRLVGTYRVIAVEHYSEDGEVGHPFGKSPDGFITYTPEGYMMAILSRSDRLPFDSNDILGGSHDEQIAAFRSASSFAGRYEILNNQIVHYLEAATFPNWKGTIQARDFEITDSHLTLCPPKLLMDGKMRTSRVHCSRLSAWCSVE